MEHRHRPPRAHRRCSVIHLARFDSIDHMVNAYRSWWNGAPYREYRTYGAVLIRLTPGDLTEYNLSLVRTPDLNEVAIAFLSPYNRAAIVPTFADPGYLVDALRFTELELAYPGLTDIVSTVVHALS